MTASARRFDSSSTSPRLAILATGEELLDGRVLEGNSHWIQNTLAPLGFSVRRTLTCGDTRAEIVSSLQFLLSESDFIIVSGGLGPTADDQTREAIAELTGETLALRPDELERLKKYYELRARVFDPANEKQAYLPRSATSIPNPNGTAPGFCMRLKSGKTIVSLPGVPRELQHMILHSVVPHLRAAYPQVLPVASRLFRLFGLPESTIGRLVEQCALSEHISVSYRAKQPEVQLRLKAADAALLDSVVPTIEKALDPRFIFSRHDDESLEQVVFTLLSQTKKTIAVAESCTGGLLGGNLSRPAGASAVFLGGALTYSNQLKQELLGVSESLLQEHGAVSAPVAIAMAKEVRQRCQSSIGVSITGIAGPSGGSETKPVGTFFIGYADAERSTAYHYFFPSARDSIRAFAVAAALDLVRRTLLGYPVQTVIGNGHEVGPDGK